MNDPRMQMMAGQLAAGGPQGGPPMPGPAPAQGAAPPPSGMPPAQAQQILGALGITPDNAGLVMEALQSVMSTGTQGSLPPGGVETPSFLPGS